VFREEAVKIFLERLEMYAKMYYELTRPKNCKPIVMTPGDKVHFINNNICHICEKVIGERKVRDHCHITGKYRGPAHESCNLNYKYPKCVLERTSRRLLSCERECFLIRTSTQGQVTS